VQLNFIHIIKTEKKKAGRYGKIKVYNLKVEEDNTYIANNIVVHNCGQSGWMRGKKLPAHLGFGVVDVFRNSKGIERLTHTFIPGYE